MSLIIMPLGVLGTNCYILSSKENNCFIIDPGAQAEKIANLLEEKKLNPVYILLTHGHHDHIGAVKKLMQMYPKIKMHIGEGDTDMLMDIDKSYASARGLAVADYIFEKLDTTKEDDVFTVDELKIGVYETPGHSKGGVTYFCNNMMFTGDTLFREEVGRTDLYGGNYTVLKQSLKKLSDLNVNYDIYPGHGESSTLDHERQYNHYMQE